MTHLTHEHLSCSYEWEKQTKISCSLHVIFRIIKKNTSELFICINNFREGAMLMYAQTVKRSICQKKHTPNLSAS